MTDLPTGTITFLFTDIEGSAKLWEQHPEAMKAALAQHDEILRQAVEANHGRIIKTTGDGIHSVFETAVSGLTAACAAQQALQVAAWEGLPPQAVRVRMGLHTGEAEIRAGDYFGSALNRAVRLMSIGSGGQVLLSGATAELLREGLPPEITLRDLGEHRLKDLARPEHVYQLVHPALPSEFPPVRSLNSVPNNLLAQLTRFIGREQETAEIIRLLDTSRLVTLTGSGGTGKTRLAQEVGAQVLAHFPQGVWLVELAPLANPSQIVPAIAQIFGLQPLANMLLAEMVTEYLREKQALLILDNCEHLIDACARLVNDLLRHCAQIKILTSSREALGIAGEVAYRIPSLQESEAVQLFVDRASAANARFNAGESSAPAIARICSRLDGIPLAIELAAARAKTLSPEQIAARLDDRFKLLVGGSRTALPRQQTLRALIDWSYDLLSEEEKRLLRTCSVFVGGWTLEALEALADDPDTLLTLEQLVNKSLVVVAEDRGAEDRESGMRYSLLETIRQYAREKLLDAGAAGAVHLRDLHLDFFLRLTRAAEGHLLSKDWDHWVSKLDPEGDNLRAALEWAFENYPLAALEIAANMAYFWGHQAIASEGYHWIRNALAQAEERLDAHEKQSPEYQVIRLKAFNSEAVLAFRLGDNRAAVDRYRTAIDLAREIHDTKALAFALAFGGLAAAFLGDIPLSYAWVEEADALSRQYRYPDIRTVTNESKIFLKLITNQPIQPEMIEEALQTARTSGNSMALGTMLGNIGRLKAAAGQLAESLASFEEARIYFQKGGDRMMYISMRSEIGHVLRKQGRYAEALAAYRETVQAFKEMDQRPAVAHELECFAFIAGAQHQSERAAILFGAAEAVREQLQSVMTLIEAPEYQAAVSNLRTQIDEAALARAWAKGRAMTIEQAIQFALA